MKKLLVLLCLTLCMQTSGYAAKQSLQTWSFKAGQNNTCFVHQVNNAGNVLVGILTLGIHSAVTAATGGFAGDEYFYCGAQGDNGCAGRYKKNNHMAYNYRHGDGFDGTEGQTEVVKENKDWTGPYWCCNTDPSTAGYFIKKEGDFATKFTKVTTEKKMLENGGTCNYTVTTDACGVVEKGDCDKPDNCIDGRILRNGECVTPCPDGQGFESEASNKCVKPETVKGADGKETKSKTSGVGVNEKGEKVVYNCDPDIELWDPYSKKCVSKRDNTVQISATYMEKCYACGNNDDFRECVRCLPKGSCSDEIKTSCRVK